MNYVTPKLDGFHARCLRRITGIKHSYISRVSNAAVLESIESPPLSAMLLEQQLKFFGNLYRRHDEDISRCLIFTPASSDLAVSEFKRRRGRPRLQWARELHKHCEQIAASEPPNSVEATLQSRLRWESAVRTYCRG